MGTIRNKEGTVKWSELKLHKLVSQVSGENTIVKTLWNQYVRLKVINGVLHRQWIGENGINNKMQMLVPESLKEDILKCVHDVPTAGHLGINKYLEKIKQHLYLVIYEGLCYEIL